MRKAIVLVLLLVAPMALAMVIALGVFARPAVTKENFQRLEAEMPLAKLETVLGPSEPDNELTSDSRVGRQWMGVGCQVRIRVRRDNLAAFDGLYAKFGPDGSVIDADKLRPHTRTLWERVRIFFEGEVRE